MKTFVKVCVLLLASALPANAAPSPSSAAFFPILPYDAGPDVEPSMLPVASNHPLEENHAGITRGIIVIHDFSRDAGKALSVVTALAGAENSRTMIMAPQFLLDSDIQRFAESLPEKGKAFTRWSLGGWASGDDSLPSPPQKSISSFTAVDLMLMFLSDRAGFPDMKEIVVVGHGEGGDFVQRYAAAGKAPDILDELKIPVRFVVADAASFLYLTTVRPQKNRQGFTPPDGEACKDYNTWPYGLDNLNAYAKRSGVNAIKTRFATRLVGYLAGENAGKADPSPDNSCAAVFQGADRPTRAINYATYTGILFGEAAGRTQNLSVEPNTGYDAAALYGSKCGMTMLFGDGDCTPASLRNTDTK